ncbi:MULTISPECIES: hypothetical protein [unclassified Modestobacter]
MSRNQRRKRRNKQSGNQKANRPANRDTTRGPAADAVRLRPSTETKSAVRTTEFIAYVGAVLAVVITALAVNDDGLGGDDPFGAESALRYITYLTVGYLLARGLAKSGSHENRIEHDTDTDSGTDDAPRTGAVHDADAHGDDERLRDDDNDGVETAGVPSDPDPDPDPDPRPTAEDADRRP